MESTATTSRVAAGTNVGGNQDQESRMKIKIKNQDEGQDQDEDQDQDDDQGDNPDQSMLTAARTARTNGVAVSNNIGSKMRQDNTAIEMDQWAIQCRWK